MLSKYAALCLAALVPAATAMISYTESQSSLQYNMSSVTTSSGTDLHFNMSIPMTHGWGAVAVGDMMTDALMFVLLPDSTNGSTISLRSATGHRMPTPVSGMTLDVMSGSAEGGVYKASAICRSCQKWNDGSLDAQSTSQSFVYAVGPGSSGVSGSGQSAQISMHSYHGQFSVDMTKAAVTDASQANNSSSTSSGSSSGVTSSAAMVAPDQMYVVAHSAILALTFALLLPIGIVVLRVPALGWIPHAAVQTLGSILAVAGLGIAVHMSLASTPFRTFHFYHQIVGLVAISVLLLNFFLGLAHHLAFRKSGGRTAVTYVHLWTGRMVIPLGIINIIFGFMLVEDTPSAIGVGVAGLLVYLVALGSAALLKRRNNKATRINSHGSSGHAGEEQFVTDKPINAKA